MPQMMPLWWLMNLIYTNLIMYLYITLIHSLILFTPSNKKFNYMHSNMKIKW